MIVHNGSFQHAVTSDPVPLLTSPMSEERRNAHVGPLRHVPLGSNSSPYLNDLFVRFYLSFFRSDFTGLFLPRDPVLHVFLELHAPVRKDLQRFSPDVELVALHHSVPYGDIPRSFL